jgi:hypothetical protein
MATKRATKKPAKKAKKAKRRVATKGKVTGAAITFRLTPAEVKKARACLERSGEIRYTFKDIRVTKLPHVLDDGKLID